MVDPQPPGALPGPGDGVGLADLDLGEWTAEQGTALEVAEWVLGALIAWCCAQHDAEARAPRPDQARLAALAADRARYAALRRNLDVHQPDRTRDILTTYGPLARARYRTTTRRGG